MDKILVISPHPDDESIGCGGTICKHIENGDEVYTIFLTSGEKGGHGLSEVETISIRETEARMAASILGVTHLEFWRQQDGNFQASMENIKRLTEAIEKISPSMIYVPHLNEEHPDHKQAALLVFSAASKTNYDPRQILMYEVWTPIQTLGMINDITAYIDLKQKAILAYESQCAVLQFDEAILGLNRYRGEMHCWPEGEYAEAFEIKTAIE
jgi:N-acetylglucosamine malate deacetylase 1